MTRRDLLWGGLAQLTNMGGLLLLPFALRFLPSGELALWFAFLALAGFAQLLEMGFQPTIARAAAYVQAGAQSLVADGLSSAPVHDAAPNPTLLADLVDAARRIYRGVALVAAAGLLLLGSGYVVFIVREQALVATALAAWWITALGSVVNFYFGYYNALLQGRGDVTGANQAVVTLKTTYVLGAIAALYAGWGLVGIGAASLASSVVGRLVARALYLHGAATPPACGDADDRERRAQLLRQLWPNARRLTVANLGGFLILRANTLIATAFLGLQAAASYGLVIQLLQALSGFANMPAALQLPRMNQLQVARDRPQLRHAFVQVWATALAVYGLGATVLLLAGPQLLALVHAQTRLLPAAQLAALCVVYALELQHSLCATYLTTFNVVPFVRSALISGVCITFIAMLLSPLPAFGAWGLVIAQGGVQLAYNNWKWPLEALRSLRGDGRTDGGARVVDRSQA